ncbi:MAG: cell wall hydrolase [Novosphingobium sp. 32-60-15]|uniref:cell wall hydrolase n=1 Tax=unclassified Novosphingobium TaxID=2644732 RepID=UPI000BC54EB2|nr:MULTISPECIES: cell wall hydrolase [unclassified Novosphingobium]OYX62796.1 MAG: cell wall hydrolase [Novosphingobium sp. 32-60-15]
MPLDVAYRPVELSCAAPQEERVRPVEARPRDFAARIRRRDMRSIRRALRAPSLIKQRMVGIAMFGLLAMVLGPMGWGEPGGIGAASAQERKTGLQPFEKAGESFPGSAFYWLAAEETGLIAPTEAQSAWDARRDDEEVPVGAMARPVLATGTGEDRWRALQCLTAAIYYEAASEPDAGQRAVAQVVLNRVAHPAWPNTVCGVVYQGSERPSCQFSFACDGSMARKPMAAFWDRARRVASDALAGYVYAPAGLATHYHTTAVHPYWAPSLTFLGTIGAHRFYRWAGNAGKPAAFTARYTGGEPVAAPHPRTWTPLPADVADPLALERAFEQGQIAANVTALPTAPMPAPIYSAPIQQRGGEALFKAEPANSPLSGSGAIRPEYENAGRWIAQPGS